MANLSFIEKETLRRLFGIGSGFVFKYWSDKNLYNKNKTRDIIMDACSINIYQDPDFRELSQQKCVEKIWDEKDPNTVSNLISGLCNYFSFQMGSNYWCDEDNWDYQQAQEIIKRLRGSTEVSLPPAEDTPDIRMIASDIETNIQQNRPEMALDRLHTYATKYLRDVCTKHGISTTDNQEKSYSIEGLVGQLRKYYEDHKCCESEFSLAALKSSTNLFAKFNDIRNDHSPTHVNQILVKQEAEYVIKIMLATLMFVDAVEKSRDYIFDIDDLEDVPF